MADIQILRQGCSEVGRFFVFCLTVWCKNLVFCIVIVFCKKKEVIQDLKNWDIKILFSALS